MYLAEFLDRDIRNALYQSYLPNPYGLIVKTYPIGSRFFDPANMQVISDALKAAGLDISYATIRNTAERVYQAYGETLHVETLNDKMVEAIKLKLSQQVTHERFYNAYLQHGNVMSVSKRPPSARTTVEKNGAPLQMRPVVEPWPKGVDSSSSAQEISGSNYQFL